MCVCVCFCPATMLTSTSEKTTQCSTLFKLLLYFINKEKITKFTQETRPNASWKFSMPILRASAFYCFYFVLRLRISTQKYRYNGRPLFSSILFGMKGRESDFPTYFLHFYIIHSSTTNRWESLNCSPSYRIQLSKIDGIVWK